MNKEYTTHYVIGAICVIVWWYGEYLKIPASAVQLAASIVPGLLGHALAYTPEVPEVEAIVKDTPAA